MLGGVFNEKRLSRVEGMEKRKWNLNEFGFRQALLGVNVFFVICSGLADGFFFSPKVEEKCHGSIGGSSGCVDGQQLLFQRL